MIGPVGSTPLPPPTYLPPPPPPPSIGDEGLGLVESDNLEGVTRLIGDPEEVDRRRGPKKWTLLYAAVVRQGKLTQERGRCWSEDQGQCQIVDGKLEKNGKIISALLEKGAAINAQHESLLTPLHAAAIHNAPQAAKLLRSRVRDDPQDRQGQTPLHHAIDHQHDKVIEALVSAGADVNRLDCQGFSPFHLVVSGGRSKHYKAFLECGALANPPGSDDKGQIMLREKIRTASLLGVRALLQAGASSRGMDKLAEGNSDLEQLLANPPRRPKTRRRKGSRRVRRGSGGLTLRRATKPPVLINKVSQELEGGATVKQLTLLLERLPPGSINEPVGNQKTTVLHVAVKRKTDSCKLVTALLRKGANPKVADGKGRTPLHAAVARGKLDIVRLLIDHGASVVTPDQQGFTALHHAVSLCGRLKRQQSGRETALQIVNLLLQQDECPLNEGDMQAWTPLHWATHLEDFEVVKLLVTAGADKNIEDSEGRTAAKLIQEMLERKKKMAGTSSTPDQSGQG